jgi:hypothetical protein
MKLWLMIIFLCFSSHLIWWCNRLEGRAPLFSVGNCQIGEVCKTTSQQGPTSGTITTRSVISTHATNEPRLSCHPTFALSHRLLSTTTFGASPLSLRHHTIFQST